MHFHALISTLVLPSASYEVEGQMHYRKLASSSTKKIQFYSLYTWVIVFRHVNEKLKKLCWMTDIEMLLRKTDNDEFEVQV